jgi:hypothetical protein
MSTGPSTSASTAAASEQQLRLQLQGLQHQVAQGQARVRRLLILALVLMVLLAALLVWLYLHHVFQFASLAELEITASSIHPGEAEIRFVPLSEGKVEFVRQAANQVETVTEYAFPGSTAEESKKEFTWSGKEIDNYTLTVRYREGLSITEKIWTPPKVPLRGSKELRTN